MGVGPGGGENSGDKINSNPFVETTLAYTLTYIAGKTPRLPAHTFDAARLTVLADNDYYSQPHSSPPPPPLPFTAENPTRFAKFPTTLGGAHKTGLGSSAALVTSLTAALLTHYLGGGGGGRRQGQGQGQGQRSFDLTTAHGRRVLHNLAQAAHCAAQGKVGSGFDVAAAVYGSIRYRRFSPSVLAGLPEAGAPGFAPALAACVDDGGDPSASSSSSSSSSSPGTAMATATAMARAWDVEALAGDVSLPPGVALRMCDVDCGSQTVGMVRQVLAWRARDPEGSRRLWDDLQAANEALGAVLGGGGGGGGGRGSSDDIDEEIGAAVARVRALVRDMGRRSGVPIEPDSQTALLDALTAGVDGVLGGVVPGAGGFDALALLVRDDGDGGAGGAGDTESRLREFLARWSAEKGAVVRLLGVRGEMEGVRAEELGQYAGWLH